MSEKNIEARYVDDKFGLVLKNIDTNSIDDVTKAVKLVLDEDCKVYELNSHYGDSNGEFSSEKIGFFVPINGLILTERKGYYADDLDRLYDSICKNIDVVLDKNNYYDFEKFALDLPKETSIEEFSEKFNEFIDNLSDEEKAEIEDNDFSNEMFDRAFDKFRNTQNLREKYNVIVVDSSEKDFNLDDYKDNTRKLTNEEQKEVYKFQNSFLSSFENNLENIDATIDLSSYIESEKYSDFVNDEVSDYLALSSKKTLKNLQEVFKEKALNEVKEDIKNNIEIREDMPVSYYSKEFLSQKNMIVLHKNYEEKEKELEKILSSKQTEKNFAKEENSKEEFSKDTKEKESKDFEIE